MGVESLVNEATITQNGVRLRNLSSKREVEMTTVADTIDSINDAWRTGRVDTLQAVFDTDMVIVGPNYEPLARGVGACVASYRDFLGASIVHEYRQSGVAIHESGPVAVASFAWEMDYEQAGKRSRERGKDLFVLRREGDEWLAVWRAVSFE